MKRLRSNACDEKMFSSIHCVQACNTFTLHDCIDEGHCLRSRVGDLNTGSSLHGVIVCEILFLIVFLEGLVDLGVLGELQECFLKN